MNGPDRELSRLDGRYAVVTGGSKGIGLGIARELLGRGAHVTIVARNAVDLNQARDVLAEAAGGAHRVDTLVADIGDADDVAWLFTEIGDRLPALDVFVSNAGTGGLTDFLDLEVAEWDRIMRVNLRGTFLGCQAAARLMVERPGEGRSILVVSSVRAQQFRPGTLPYSCTKAALNQFVRAVAVELAPHRIRVNAVSPGMTVTPLMLERTPEVEDIAAGRIPFGRAGQPVDVAQAAEFLCSPAAGFVTGSNLAVDGGEALC